LGLVWELALLCNSIILNPVHVCFVIFFCNQFGCLVVLRDFGNDFREWEHASHVSRVSVVAALSIKNEKVVIDAGV